MYKINESSYKPVNFFAGDYPIARDYGDIKAGVTINQYAPLVLGEDGIEEAKVATLDKLIGIAAEAPSNGKVVYYMTGEFFAGAIALPAGITLEALKPACRKMNIFLKELNENV